MTRWILAILLPWVYGFSPSSPAWTASDRLDFRRGVPRAGAIWLRSDITTWDALPGSMATRIALGREPNAGGGLRIAWDSFHWPDGAMHEWEGTVIWRASKWRAECALGRLMFKDEHSTRCSPRLLVAVSPHLVTGGSMTLYPESPRAAPDFEIEARSSAGPWLLGLVLHENTSEAAIGLEARPGLTVIARYRNDAPALGIVFDARSLELRAEAEDHPFLGRMARVAFRWLRGRS